MNNKVSTKFFMLRFLIVMISIVFLGNMYAIRNIYIPFRNLQYSVTFFLFLWVALLFVLTSSARSKPIIANTFYFLLLITVVTFISYYNGSMYTSFNILTKALFWAVALIAGYSFSFRYEGSVSKSLFVTAFLPIFLSSFLLIKEYLIQEDSDTAMITSAYYLLCLLPFVFLIKNKIIKSVFVVIIGAAVLISSKRTGFLAFTIAILVYLFFSIILDKKARFKLIRYILIVLLLCFVLLYVIEQFDFNILDRLQATEEDKGSGRTSVYASAWKLIKQTDLVSFFFGKGYNRVYRDMGLNLSAHTDFLEVLYDYGLFGFMLYINMYLIMLRYAVRLCKEKSSCAAAFISALVIMLILSAFSHLIIFNTYFIYLCLFFGLIMGDYDRREKERLCEQ